MLYSSVVVWRVVSSENILLASITRLLRIPHCSSSASSLRFPMKLHTKQAVKFYFQNVFLSHILAWFLPFFGISLFLIKNAIFKNFGTYSYVCHICHEYDRKYYIEIQHAKKSIVLLRKQQKYKTSVKMKGVFEQ